MLPGALRQGAHAENGREAAAVRAGGSSAGCDQFSCIATSIRASHCHSSACRLNEDYGTGRIITTGKGFDSIDVTLSGEYDWIGTSVTITDFTSGQDRLKLTESNWYEYDTEVLQHMDTDYNGHINGNDGWSYEGYVEANYQNNSLTLHVNEDTITLLNTTDFII